MKRRGFLGLFGKAAAAVVAAPVLAKIPAPVEKFKITESYGISPAFGLAQVKLEGATAAYDTSGIITTGNFQKAIWPGIDKFFNETYAEHETGFEDIFK